MLHTHNTSVSLYILYQLWKKGRLLLRLANAASDKGAKSSSNFRKVQPVCATSAVATFAQDVYGRRWVWMSYTATLVAEEFHGNFSPKLPRDSHDLLGIHGRCITLELHIPGLNSKEWCNRKGLLHWSPDLQIASGKPLRKTRLFEGKRPTFAIASEVRCGSAAAVWDQTMCCQLVLDAKLVQMDQPITSQKKEPPESNPSEDSTSLRIHKHHKSQTKIKNCHRCPSVPGSNCQKVVGTAPNLCQPSTSAMAPPGETLVMMCTEQWHLLRGKQQPHPKPLKNKLKPLLFKNNSLPIAFFQEPSVTFLYN